MGYDFRLNPNRSVKTEYMGQERQPVLVFDDLLLNPSSAVSLAANLPFAPSGSPYPGVLAPIHPNYVTSVLSAIRPWIGGTFGLNAEAQAKLYSCFFGIVTTPPEQLQDNQREPHIDTPDLGRLAFLHYLCDPSHGGTAFYRHRATGWESLDADRQAQVMRAHATDPRPIAPGYLAGSSERFEHIGAFEARYNRALVYRSRVLHCAEIHRPNDLSADPRAGRLTANVFLEFPPAH